MIYSCSIGVQSERAARVVPHNGNEMAYSLNN